MIDQGDRITPLKSQVEHPRQTHPNFESSTEAAPSWMPGTLGDSSLMRKASKYPETSQECRSGYENLVGEVSDSDSR
jgi:hypothetical protein